MSFRTKWTKAKLLVLGSQGVGKTAFTVRYLTKRFIGEYDTNHEETYCHKAVMDKDEVTLDIVDTANGDDEQLEHNIKSADGYIILYSLVDRDSFMKIHHYYHQIQNNRKSEDFNYTPLVIVGTKKDLDHVRKVSADEGRDLAYKYGCPVFEVSTAESPGEVCDVMTEILKQMKREFLRLHIGLEKKSTLNNMKRVFRKKITRSKSDSYH